MKNSYRGREINGLINEVKKEDIIKAWEALQERIKDSEEENVTQTALKIVNAESKWRKISGICVRRLKTLNIFSNKR